ncbi:MAG: hypothetical protein K9N21_09595 [Deltaproteobacteria bacterium]|nr:hypothetical protein [Deltaproteobacteria bacterium]
MLMFSENKEKWQPIPKWAQFLINFGFQWQEVGLGYRRIALVSMPCDSAAAGLIALGALIRDLGNPKANNVDGHYDALLRYAQQYLQSCRNCPQPCNPKKARCGYSERATGWVRNWRNTPAKRYMISERSNIAKNELFYSIEDGTWWQNRTYSLDWQIEGEPPPQLDEQEGVLKREIYTNIIESAQLIPDNLRQSFSGLCLAGRVGGKIPTYRSIDSIRFRINSVEYPLPTLLTIKGWSHLGSISRMSFFNSKTESLDRKAHVTSTVVVDGDKSFVKVLGLPSFQRSDVIGIFSRVLERNDLESVGHRIQGLYQWYEDDQNANHRFSPVPRGISVRILRRKRN